jgi:hypothetical protein
VKTYQIIRYSEIGGGWSKSGTKDTLSEAIASVRYQWENWIEGGESIGDFQIIEKTERLVFEFPCSHDELDHGICMSCGEDRDMNSHRFGKTAHESIEAAAPSTDGAAKEGKESAGQSDTPGLLVNQQFVDHIVARAQNSMMGLGDPETSYDLSKYDPANIESVAILLVSAHHAKYDLVSLFAAGMEEIQAVLERQRDKAKAELQKLHQSA